MFIDVVLDCDYMSFKPGKYHTYDHDENTNEEIVQCLIRERNIFIIFCLKYLSFTKEPLESEKVLKDKPLESCTMTQLKFYLKEHGINAHPWPKDKEILLKICYQFNLIQDKLQAQCLTKYHADGVNIYAMACKTSNLCVEMLLCSYENYLRVIKKGGDAKEKLKSQLNGYFVDDLDVSLHLDLVINAQYFLPINIDLYKLENWQSNDSLKDIFGRFRNITRACSIANISYDELSYYLAIDCQLQSKIDNNHDNDKIIDDGDNDQKYVDIRTKYITAWKEVTSGSSRKYSTFDSVYQIFVRCAEKIDNVGLDLLFSDDKGTKNSFYDKWQPMEVTYANKKDDQIRNIGYIDCCDGDGSGTMQRCVLLDVCCVKVIDLQNSSKILISNDPTTCTKDNKLPLICVKYIDMSVTRCTTIDREKAIKEIHYFRTKECCVEGTIVDIDTISMLSKLLEKNRKLLNHETLKQIEKKYISPENQLDGKWKCSVFVPSCIKDEQSSKCQICDKNAVALCSRCKQVRYCSTDCQRKDWKIRHSAQCKKNLPSYQS